MQKEGGIWLFHWSIFGVVPSTLMFSCLVQCVADRLHQSCTFYPARRRMLSDACHIMSLPAESETRWTQSVFVFFVFFVILIKVIVRVNQAPPHNLSFLWRVSRPTAMWQGGGGNGGCLTLCWSLTCSVDCIFVLLQTKGTKTFLRPWWLYMLLL